MGRQVYRVPADWVHPKKEGSNQFQPMDMARDFATAAREWLDEAVAWDNGTHKDLQPGGLCAEGKAEYPFYWMWSGEPPEQDYYRPTWQSEPTHYQVYENVSEGTPVTPVFATESELVDYLVAHGDFWDQSRGDGGWKREHAENFIQRAYAPSLMIANGQVCAPRDGDPT